MKGVSFIYTLWQQLGYECLREKWESQLEFAVVYKINLEVLFLVKISIKLVLDCEGSKRKFVSSL